MFHFRTMMNAFSHPGRHPDIVALKAELQKQRGLVAAVVRCLEQRDIDELARCRNCDKALGDEVAGKIKRA